SPPSVRIGGTPAEEMPDSIGSNALESDAPISSVPPSASILTAALASEAPPPVAEGPDGAVIPPGPPVPRLDRLSEYPIERPSVRDDVYDPRMSAPGGEVYERFESPPGPPIEEIPRTDPEANPEPRPTIPPTSEPTFIEESEGQDLDSRPPSIP